MNIISFHDELHRTIGVAVVDDRQLCAISGVSIFSKITILYLVLRKYNISRAIGAISVFKMLNTILTDFDTKAALFK